MNYAQRISEIAELSMDSIIENCRKHVPAQYRRMPYKHPELNHGLDLLQSDAGLDCYIVAYGEMHQAKMRAVLQNLPFPPIKKHENLNCEIIDWGCGQGIGTICLLDYLKEHDLISHVKKITLVEPSQVAIDRAYFNVINVTNERVYVVPINKYISAANEDTDVKGISYTEPFVFHIFSNILDVDDVDQAKLAKCIASAGHTHYLLCTGPLNAASFRIDRFCEIFKPQYFFADINNRNYGRTSDTNYCFTCKARGFVYDGTSLDLSEYSPNEKAKSTVFKEYEFGLHASNGLMSADKELIYHKLLDILNPDDLIYLDPEINGAAPDFVIVRPNVGVLVIVVFDECLSSCQLVADNTFLVANSSKGKAHKIQSPCVVLDSYQNQIIESLKELTKAVTSNFRNLGLIKKVLICTGGSEIQAKKLLSTEKFRYTKVYGKEFIKEDDVAQKLFDDVNFKGYNNVFDRIMLTQIKQDLSFDWHFSREGEVFNLTTAQKNLAKSVSKAQHKICGVAGSGKTQVLVTRAVNAQKRTGGDILLLTFNVTLINYLKMRIEQVKADFPRNKIHVNHYHRFFRQCAQRNNLHTVLESYDNPNFFDNADDLPKFEGIFIDEVQDYKPNWLKILQKYFLGNNGEFVVFGDPKQNVYKRALDKDGNILLGVIPGLWNKTLTKGYRFTNPAFAQIAMSFQSRFLPYDVDRIEESPKAVQLTLAENSYYKFLSAYSSVQDIYQVCKEFIESNDIELKEVVILASERKLLQELDFVYRHDQEQETMVTFVSKEIKEELARRFSPYSMQYKLSYDRVDKAEKYRFTMLSHKLKMSTIYSFKGWEAKTVICIIQAGDSEQSELVYTAITRAKDNILVINLGNSTYHEFFKKNMTNL